MADYQIARVICLGWRVAWWLSLHLRRRDPVRSESGPLRVSALTEQSLSRQFPARELDLARICPSSAVPFQHTLEKPLRRSSWRFPGAATPGRPLKAFGSENSPAILIVDAGMREPWHSAWMHNRVRMIVASFLVKQSAAAMADWRSSFWGHARRRRSRQQCGKLAIYWVASAARHGRWPPLFPGVQSNAAWR